MRVDICCGLDGRCAVSGSVFDGMSCVICAFGVVNFTYGLKKVQIS